MWLVLVGTYLIGMTMLLIGFDACGCSAWDTQPYACWQGQPVPGNFAVSALPVVAVPGRDWWGVGALNTSVDWHALGVHADLSAM